MFHGHFFQIHQHYSTARIATTLFESPWNWDVEGLDELAAIG